MPYFGGFWFTLNCEEILGLTQNSLEGLLTSSGLRMPRDPPGGAGKHCLRGMSGIPCFACCLFWMDRWIINVESSPYSAASSGLESFLVDLQWLVDKSNGFENVMISCFCLSFMKVNKESWVFWTVVWTKEAIWRNHFGLIFGNKDFNRLIVKKMCRKLDNCQLSNKC